MHDIKAILFDIDGVLIRPPNYFSKELEQNGYKNAQTSLDEYYCNDEHIQSLEGKVDCKHVIDRYLKKIQWEHSASEYLQQQFEFERKYLDDEMMHIIMQIRTKGLICCIATDQEENRARYLLQSLNFNTVFDAQFISCFIGVRKCNTLYWDHVVGHFSNHKNRIKPYEIAFFDDIKRNIDTALRHGIKAFLFNSVQQFKEDVASLGIELLHG